MQAIEIREYGAPEVLQLAQRPDPVPKAGEILIRVAAAGINRPDVFQRTGNYPVPPGASDLPGLEVAGVVAGGDHAGYNETSFLLATRPELVEQDRLSADAPWYCRQDEEKNSWTANAEHGQAMVDAVVETWVAKIDRER